ncbi:MAG: carboxylating nicotinate-nucleotide diphosphorylase [Armatimonadetes bacterium]|nr:carboxylating nicotinate-nucleotide diphosphorylase [Armatimonadota bacterium]
MIYLPELYPFQIQGLVEAALREDLGGAGDVTTSAIVPRNCRALGEILVRRDGRIAGTTVAAAVFRALSSEFQIEHLVRDGEDAGAGQIIMRLVGPARELLSGERVALNFLGRMSGIATAARTVVQQISATSAKVVCTRKTTPGLRVLEKYAVRAGGAASHRFGLDDGILIKDNHRALAGGVSEAVRRARLQAGHMQKIEVEVEDFHQLLEALDAGVDAVLLDNMSLEQLRESVEFVDRRLLTEASGGISPEKALQVASTGVDLLSMGWLTHSAPSLDVSLEVKVHSGVRAR